MKKMRSLFVLTLFLWSCGGANENPLTFDTTQLDRQAQPGGNFLNPDTFPIDQLEFGGDRDEFPALIDQAMVPRGNENTLYLQDHDLVLGVEINGDVRAYPHNIFWWHEIANDVVGGVPIIVTFCPLTGTGIAFDARDSDGSRIILGVSGLLFNNNLVMYDQRDGETLYPQMTGVAISGPRKGQQLKQIPVVETTWEHWQQRHSNTKIVSGLTDADPGGLYTLNPYKHDGVDNNRDLHDFIPFALTLPIDENPIGNLFRSKELVLGVRFDEIAKAYPHINLGARSVVNDDVAGNPLVIIWDADMQMAVPFSRQVAGKTLTFDMIGSNEDAFPFLLKDRETETVWNLRGQGIRGQHQGQKLAQIPSTNAFWFAWATFWQNTGIY
jgi:hypothetical protein